MRSGQGRRGWRPTGIIYWHPALYSLAMRLLDGRRYEDRYRWTADLVPEGASLTEICPGDFHLYRAHLRGRVASYCGLDRNPVFVRFAKRHGIEARVFDLLRDPVPEDDVILIQGSLYQFIPYERQALGKLLRAARRRLIVSERTGGLSVSPNRLFAGLSRVATNPGPGSALDGTRFDRESLLRAFGEFRERLIGISEHADGREITAVFRGSGGESNDPVCGGD